MYVERYDVELTGSTGSSTSFSRPITGRILQFRYPQSTDYNLSTGAKVSISLEDSGVVVLTTQAMSTKFTSFPRSLTHKSTNGAAATDREPTYAYRERVKFTVASGSSSTTATTGLIYMWVG